MASGCRLRRHLCSVSWLAPSDAALSASVDLAVNEQALRERAALGSIYKEHLDDIRAAIEAVEDQYASAWTDCFDSAERDNLWHAVRVCRKVKEHFGSLVSAGTLATHQLTELKRLNK
jgi:hypothetical protein